MSMTNRPPVWQMIREATEQLGDGPVPYTTIKERIRSKYGEVNEGTLNAQLIICTVNQPSRIHYTENQKPRLANSRYDFLYSVGRGTVMRYDPNLHGLWEITKDSIGKLVVKQTEIEVDIAEETIEERVNQSFGTEEHVFPFESHLRDFIIKNIGTIRINDKRLKLYADENGRQGVEYPTDVGILDILAVDEDNNLIVFELKLGRGPYRTVGQILRYMGWVQRHLARGRSVMGVIVAQNMGEQLRYAVSMTPNIFLFEYEVSFKLKLVGLT
jgi:endonuclease